MKNGKNYIQVLSFIIVFILYLTDVSLAMAAPDEKTGEAAVGQHTVSGSTLEATDNDTDIVSTADEFTEWLESHRSNGGRVRLTNHIVLREFYYFSPVAANRPDIFVDTDRYTITAAGKITFLSDGHLIFQGKAGSQGIFRAMKGSLLTLDGVIVENRAQTSDSYAVWQEEGAGLVVGGTYVESRITGEIHYAAAPFVTKTDPVCVVVEKGQTAESLLPGQIKGSINRQGHIQDNVQIPVSWDLTGTEGQQEKRLRFQVRGTSLEAVFDVPPVCTVVYNDYPLTFTTVDAFIRANAYYFQGGYTKPEKELPIVVAPEYSFDGSSWITCDEETVSNVNTGFSIYFPCEQWDSDRHPYVYIRLQGNKDGKEFLSNMLRYESDNMGEAEDIGGSRGGGTSIVNPPDKPNENSSDKPSGTEQSSNDRKSSDKDSEKHDDVNSDTNTSDNSQPADSSAPADTAGGAALLQNMQPVVAPGTDQPNDSVAAESIVDPADNHDAGSAVSNTEPTGNTNRQTGKNKDRNTEKNKDSSVKETNADAVRTETMDVMSRELAASVQEETVGNSGAHQQMTVIQKINTTRSIVLVAGFVTLSAGAGVVTYFVRISRIRRHRRKRAASSKTSSRKKVK